MATNERRSMTIDQDMYLNIYKKRNQKQGGEMEERSGLMFARTKRDVWMRLNVKREGVIWTGLPLSGIRNGGC